MASQRGAYDFFRSERLVYRHIEPPASKENEGSGQKRNAHSQGDEALAVFWEQLAWDASHINASPALWTPPSAANQAELLRGYSTRNRLISVYVCLPVPAGTEGAVRDPAHKSSLTDRHATGSVPTTTTTPTIIAATAATTTTNTAGSTGNDAEKEESECQWVIPVGQIGLTAPPEPHVRFAQHRQGTIGLTMLTAHQGRGYGGEALRWIVDWGFRIGGLHRIKIQCGGWNQGAARLYQRTGFRLEGVERETEWFLGAWRDLWTLAMLETEYLKLPWVIARAEAAEKSAADAAAGENVDINTITTNLLPAAALDDAAIGKLLNCA